MSQLASGIRRPLSRRVRMLAKLRDNCRVL